MSTIKWNYLAIFAAAAIAVAPGFASPIAVTNFSFETLPGGGLPSGCGPGCSFSATAAPGWVTTGGSGQFQPGVLPGPYFTSLSDGPTNGYSNGGGFSQTVLPTVQLGMLYVLNVDIGFRLDTAFAGTARLLINGTPYDAVGLTPVQGTFGTFTATYTGLAADVGQAITIELNSNGTQGNFDNVLLDGTAPAVVGAPEPATFLLLVPALLMLRRRRQHSVRD